MNEQLKKTVIQLLTEQILRYALLKAPYLAWGPFPWLVSRVVSKVLLKAIDFGILELSVAMIKKEINEQIENVREIVDQYTDDKDEQQQKELDEKLKKAYSDLFKF